MNPPWKLGLVLTRKVELSGVSENRPCLSLARKSMPTSACMTAVNPRSEAPVSFCTCAIVLGPVSRTSKTRWRIAASRTSGGTYPQANCMMRSGVTGADVVILSSQFGIAKLYLFPATLLLAVGSGEGRDEFVSLLAGSVDTLNQIRHIALQADRGVFERADRPRI